MNWIVILILILVCGLIAIGKLIAIGIAALKDVLEYLKERKELKWM